MITSLHNPLVKQIRKLHRSKGRREQNLLILEGTHLLETASLQECSLITVCYTAAWRDRYPQLWETLHGKANRMELVSEEVLQALATTVNPDGVIATLAPPENRILSKSLPRLSLVLERLQDPGNLGTIIRTSVATGVEEIWLSGDSVDFDHPKVLRASAGAWFQVPLRISDSLPDIIQTYRQQGLQVVATLPQAQQTYWEIDFSRPTLIVLGNEGAGLSTDLVNLAHQKVTIPLENRVESLNVAIAAAVILYEAQRQRHKSCFPL